MVEYAAGGRVAVGDLWDIKTTWKSRTKPIAANWHRDPRQNCMRSLSGAPFAAAESFLGEQMVHGNRAAAIQRGNATEWFALDQGCALLRAKHDFGDSISEQELIGFTPGEPDATLFHVPLRSGRWPLPSTSRRWWNGSNSPVRHVVWSARRPRIGTTTPCELAERRCANGRLTRSLLFHPVQIFQIRWHVRGFRRRRGQQFVDRKLGLFLAPLLPAFLDLQRHHRA